MPSPTSERATWSVLPETTITLNMNPMCYGRGCFSFATQRRISPTGAVGVYCDACAERVKAKEAEGG